MTKVESKSNLSPDLLELACEPIPKVRIAFIGLGKRGKESLQHYLHIDGVEVMVLCDINHKQTVLAKEILGQYATPDVYNAPDDWKKVCERSDIDLVYVCTSRWMHAQIAVYAMQCNKHVALEVPAANSIAECWAIIDAAEKYRRHCFLLENCCYDYFEMTVLNMRRQGLTGEIIHAESSYFHDLTHIDFEQRPDYKSLWQMRGNPYPTHSMGPICQLLDIHRGDRLKSLVSVSSGQFNFPSFAKEKDENLFCLGNINTTIIKTEKNKTIVLQHDISSPQPYARKYKVMGTQSYFEKGAKDDIIVVDSCEHTSNRSLCGDLLYKHEHPFYAKYGEMARKVGAHGGMDYIMDARLIYCLQNGLPLDIDVYDAAEWSAIIELSAISVKNNSCVVEIPDFTRGRWDKLSQLNFYE